MCSFFALDLDLLVWACVGLIRSPKCVLGDLVPAAPSFPMGQYFTSHVYGVILPAGAMHVFRCGVFSSERRNSIFLVPCFACSFVRIFLRECAPTSRVDTDSPIFKLFVSISLIPTFGAFVSTAQLRVRDVGLLRDSPIAQTNLSTQRS